MSDLVVEGLSKRYGSVRALANVSATFQPGEIHAVLGENGAGKSTLMGVLAGFVVPDSGSVHFGQAPLPLGKPFECRRTGIAMVHQHFTLVPDFTVRENLALTRVASPWRRLRLEDLSEPALKLGRDLGWLVDPEAKVRNLPVGARQRIEILKTLADDSPVLILDEPTAVLAPDEVLDLFRVLRTLKGRGKTVILIAHKLSEVFAVADRVTVLRRGEFVATSLIGEVDEKQLAEWMVGELPPGLAGNANASSEDAFSLKRVSALGDRGEIAVKSVDLEVHCGEILGIGGVDGNGQVELAEVVVGVRPLSQGKRLWRGEPAPKDLRIAYIPQDRQTDGLALSMSIEDNMLIEGHRRPRFLKGPFLRMSEVSRWAASLVERFQIKTPSAKELASSLSGGNQQKVVVSRSLDETPALLVCVNPTRGLDIRAADFVHRQILAARDAGAAVLLVSTDLDELSALADRTLFLSRGELREASDAAAYVGGGA